MFWEISSHYLKPKSDTLVVIPLDAPERIEQRCLDWFPLLRGYS